MMTALLAAAGWAQNREDIVIGRRTVLPSKILAKDMQLSIHVPGDYESGTERHPVLFTFQTHFAQVAGAVRNLYDYSLIPDTIVVTIDNYEFGYLTPSKVDSDADSGQADRFLQFFEEELFPFIDEAYRTEPYRIVFSNSWGAMFAVYAVLAKPEVFDAAIASIPWLPYDGDKRFMLNNVERFLTSRTYGNFLYMAMDNEAEILPDLNAFLAVLNKLPRPGLRWEYHYWPEEDHTSTPYRSIYSGLRALFEDWSRIPPDKVHLGLQAIKAHEADLNRRFGYKIGISPAALRAAGRDLQTNKDYDEAVAIYSYALEKQPDNPMAYITLGRVLEGNGNLRDAREAYARAYELALAASHPQVRWIKGFLDRIEERIKKR